MPIQLDVRKCPRCLTWMDAKLFEDHHRLTCTADPVAERERSQKRVEEKQAHQLAVRQAKHDAHVARMMALRQEADENASLEARVAAERWRVYVLLQKSTVVVVLDPLESVNGELEACVFARPDSLPWREIPTRQWMDTARDGGEPPIDVDGHECARLVEQLNRRENWSFEEVRRRACLR